MEYRLKQLITVINYLEPYVPSEDDDFPIIIYHGEENDLYTWYIPSQMQYKLHWYVLNETTFLVFIQNRKGINYCEPILIHRLQRMKYNTLYKLSGIHCYLKGYKINSCPHHKRLDSILEITDLNHTKVIKRFKRKRALNIIKHHLGPYILDYIHRPYGISSRIGWKEMCKAIEAMKEQS